MSGNREQGMLRTVASRALAPTMWARVFRVVLVFSLVFWSSLRLEYKVAYAADPNPDEASIYDVEIKEWDDNMPSSLNAGDELSLWASGTYTETVMETHTVTNTVEEEEEYEDEDGKTKTRTVEKEVEEEVEEPVTTTYEDTNFSRYLDWTVEGEGVSVELVPHDSKMSKDYVKVTVAEDAPDGTATVTCAVAEGYESYFYDPGFTASVSFDIVGAEVEGEKFTLTYDANGGSGEMESGEAAEGESVDAAACGFEAPEGMKFKEWNTQEDGKGTSYAAGDPVTLDADLTLYAQWEKDEGGEGGDESVDPADSYSYVEGIEIVGNDEASFEREGSTATVKLPITAETTYEFKAKVTAILDSNDPNAATQFTCTPTAGLKDQAAGQDAELSDLKWSIEILSSGEESGDEGDEGAEGGEGATEGTEGAEGEGAGEGEGTPADGEGEGAPAAAGTASIDSATGILTISPGMKVRVICTSEEGFGWPTAEGSVFVADDGVIVDTTQGSDEETEHTLTYDANGGTGEMEPVVLATGESTTVAECAFEPPAAGEGGTEGTGENGEGAGEGTGEGAGEGTGEGTQPAADGTEPATPAAGEDETPGADVPGDSTEPSAGEEGQGGEDTPKPLKFANWNTAPDGSGVSYAPGDPITLTADTTLYAQWSTGADEIDGDFTLTYDANGGKGEMEPVTSENGEPIEVADCTFESPTGRSFSGWCTSVDGMGKMYEPGTSIQLKADTTLYAQWGRGNEFGCEIDYTPVEKGEWALLTGIAYGTGDSSFGFIWEYSKGGDWEYVTGEESFINDDSPQTLRVKTTDETLGMQFRATVQTSDDREAVSDSVEIVEGNSKLIISYEPVHYGETALFQLTSKLKNATYQWQVSHDTQTTWENVDGAKGMTLAVPTIEGNLGAFYRVIATVKGQEKQERSNALMLTATTDTPGDDDPEKDEGDHGDDEDADDEEGVPVVPEDAFDDDGDDEGDYDEEEEGEPAPAPTPTPAPEPTPEPEQPVTPPGEPVTFTVPGGPSADPNKTEVVIDPEVQQKISESEKITKEEQENRTPGAHWRKVDVIPTPEEVQKVLDSNPLAPLVLPLTLALLACGCVERLLTYRRQTAPGLTHFA